MENNFFTLPDNFALSETLSEEDMMLIQLKLWSLLARRVKLYTVGDSSSVPIETAKELLLSISFTIKEATVDGDGGSLRVLSGDFEELFNQGQKIIEAKILEGKKLWEAACLSAPKVQNISYNDTLKSIGEFFKRYDFQFLAHQIPSDIDYQLLRPVSEELLGIEYINEYLRRIITENKVLSAFSEKTVIRLLTRAYLDYRGLLINICEPVVINAAGLIMLGKIPSELNITDIEREEIEKLLKTLSEKETYDILYKAAKQLCMSIGLKDSFTEGYIAKAVTDIYPRLNAALDAGDISNLFLTFG